MLRLNGDITKQLESIYNIRFHLKYKNELKDRIISFVNHTILSFFNNDFFETLNHIKLYVLIEDNRPIKITSLFFDKYKDELFNSFNPIWYSLSLEKKQHLSKRDFNNLTFKFLHECCFSYSYLQQKNLDPFSIFGKASIELDEINFNYSKNIYKKIYFSLNKDFENFRIRFIDLLTIRYGNEHNVIQLFSSFDNLIENNTTIIKTDLLNFFHSNRIILHSEEFFNLVTSQFYHLYFLYKFILIAKEKAGI